MDNYQQFFRYPNVNPYEPMSGDFLPVCDASATPVAYCPASLSFPNTGLAAQQAAFAPESWADRPNPSRYEYPVSMHRYTLQEVRGVLRAAERWRDPRVKILTSSVAHSWSPLLDTVHVAIVEPGSGQGSDWLLLVFDRRAGIAFHGGDAYVAIGRAYGLMETRTIPFSAAWYPKLKGRNGGVFATALAVWISREWRADYAYSYTISEKRARKEHKLMLDGWCPDITSVRITGRATLTPSIEV